MDFMKLRVIALGSALALGACASTRTAPTTGPVWDAEGLVGSMWTEVCPDGQPEQTWLALYEDGTFAYLYPGESWLYDGDETWSVDGGDLVIVWSGGYANTRYSLAAGSRLTGRSTKPCPTITLEYVGPAPELDWTEQPGEAPLEEPEESSIPQQALAR